MSKVYRIDYKVPEVTDEKISSIFTKADSLGIARKKTEQMPFWWVVVRIEQDTEENYEKWLMGKGGDW